MANISFKSFFGLELEVNTSENIITLKQNDMAVHSWKKEDKGFKEICRELRLDAGENRQEVTGWVIVKLLRGEKLHAHNIQTKYLTRLSTLKA